MTEGTKKEKQHNTTKPVDDDSINNGASNDHDDEFVSDLHQASSKDIAEADEAMKKLGLTKVNIIFFLEIHRHIELNPFSSTE